MGRIFASAIWGVNFWEGLLSEFYGISNNYTVDHLYYTRLCQRSGVLIFGKVYLVIYLFIYYFLGGGGGALIIGI